MRAVMVTVTFGLSARWLMSGLLVLLHIMPEGDPSVTILGVLSFLVIHEISAAITLLNIITFMLATYLNNSVLPQDINFYYKLPVQPGCKRAETDPFTRWLDIPGICCTENYQKLFFRLPFQIIKVSSSRSYIHVLEYRRNVPQLFMKTV